MNVTSISEKILLNVKLKEPTHTLVDQLKDIPFEVFRYSLQTDASKKAFWINIYNAYFQLLRLEIKVGKPDIFLKKLIYIAGISLSLDDIEHGILRHRRLKWALGYLPDPFVSAPIKLLAVQNIDYRIHFALNCGARSCPPIAFYTSDKIEQQLDMATRSFLDEDILVMPVKKEVHLSSLFQWFIGDFGGRKGIRNLLIEQLGLDTTGMKLIFKKYDWTEQLDNFQDL